MANNAFKIKDSLILKPVDLTAITNPVEGQLATDETDGLLKQYNSTLLQWIPTNTVDLDTAQTLENKTLVSSQINSPTIDSPTIDGPLTLEELAVTPSTPSAGYKKLYPKSGLLYTLDDAGNEVPVGSGIDGSGFRNFISPSNSDFELGVGDWITFDDGTSFVDGTGGTPSAITIAQTTNSNEVLEKLKSLKISKSAASGLGEGTSVVTENIDRAARGEINYITFQYDATSTNYVANDLVVKIYDVTNSVELSALTTNIGLDKAKSSMNVPFLVPITCEVVRVAIYCNTTNALAYDVIIDKVSVSNQTLTATVDNITEWEEFTPTLNSLTSVSVRKAWKRRVGQNMEIRGFVLYNGVGASTEFFLTIPDSLNIDTTSASNTTAAAQLFGVGYWYDDVGGLSDAYQPDRRNNNTLYFRKGSPVLSNVFANNDRFTWYISVPILEWKGQSTTGLVQNSQLSKEDLILSTNVTTTGNIADLQKTDLVVGKWYLVTGTILASRSGSGADVQGTIYNSSNTSIVIGNFETTQTGAASTDGENSSLGISILFQAQTSNFRVVVDTLSGSSLIRGSGDKNDTFITITEFPFSQTAIVQQNKVATIKDVKASGVDAGSSPAASRVDRVLNSLDDPFGLVTSLSSNVFTLKKGVYYVEASVPAYRVNKHQSSLTTSANTLVIAGSAEETDNVNFVTTRSMLSGILTADGTTSYKIRHYTQTSVTGGLGRASATGDPEVYTIVTITKIAE